MGFVSSSARFYHFSARVANAQQCVMSRNSSQIRLKTNLVEVPSAHPPHTVSSAAPGEDKEWETEARKAVGNFLLAMHYQIHNQLALVV